MSFYHAIHAARLVQMPSKKKKRSCLFSSATTRWKKPKKWFSSDWAENLAESDKGSFFDKERWLKEFNKKPSVEYDPSVSTSTVSASQSTIKVEEPLADLEKEILRHDKLSSMATLSKPVKICRKKEKINELVTCCF